MAQMRKPMIHRCSLLVLLALAALSCQSPADRPYTEEMPAPSIEGAWAPERYLLKDGSEHTVTGRIFFTEREWTVVFFVLGDDETPQQGSGEGGTYTLEGDQLVFFHHYNLSGGEATGSLAERPFRMTLNPPDDAPDEPCTIELSDTEMTIHFPSGNAMTFRRTSGLVASG